jgi:lipopolysaccharide/colanic/teichoic acid biosynthesis glycosyltransferase
MLAGAGAGDDYLSVPSWSLWWDVKILFQTIPVVLGRRGAY